MIPMQAVGVYTHVNRAYEQSEAFQWAREAVVNSVQAGAKQIVFGVEWEAVKHKNVYRRMIADDGCGMSAQDMPAFLNKYGGSGRTIGDISGNYGIGLKTSVLPWNAYGVVILSVVTDAEKMKRVNMMWLCRSTAEDGRVDYGARELLDDEFDDDFKNEWTSLFPSAYEAPVVFPLDRVEAAFEGDNSIDGIDWLKVIPDFIWKAGHGTVIVMLGDTGEEDTIKGDPHREAENNSKYALTEYLNTRFYRLPEGVTVRVVTMEAQTTGTGKDWNNKELWPKKPTDAGVNRRTVIGMDAVLKRYSEIARKHREKDAKVKPPCIETTVLNGGSVVPASVTTYLFPDIGSSKPGQISWTGYQAGDMPSIPIFACIHEAHPGIVEAFAVQTHTKGKVALLPWVNTDMVRRRLAIVVEPTSTDTTKVFPDPSRRSLHYQDRVKGGADMPMDVWTEAYQKLRPAFITKAIDDYFATFTSLTGEVDEETLRRVGSQYLPYMRTVLVRRRGRKRRVVVDTNEGASAEGSGGPRTPSEDCKRGGKLWHVPYGLLDAVLMDVPDPDFPLQKNSDQSSDAPIIEIHYKHRLIQSAWEASKERLLHKNGVSPEQILTYENGFYREVKIHVQLAATHMWQYVRDGHSQLRDKLFSPEALLGIVAGIRPLQQAAQGIFGTIKAGKEVQ